ncbi:MAG: Rieske (2Fe-2S) protein [Chitinophagales bacterium]|jgi:cytochrome b6-f complex iron-sulfur subunit|nr:Rieske (2Fe-2S) protein [Chitinophagales bacterium]
MAKSISRKEFIRLIGSSAVAVVALSQLGCQKADTIPLTDFYIDLSNGSVNDNNGHYSTIPDFTNLYLTGGFVYVNGIIVFKGLDQQFYALSQYCTHQGCNVEYEVAYNEIVCPCHQSHFDIYGNVTMGPAYYPLYQYAVSQSGSILHIYTP